MSLDTYVLDHAKRNQTPPYTLSGHPGISVHAKECLSDGRRQILHRKSLISREKCHGMSN